MEAAAIGRPMTIPIDPMQRQFHLFRMRAGQIVKHLALRDDLGLLRQLGMLS
jgi:hypothetical protein